MLEYKVGAAVKLPVRLLTSAGAAVTGKTNDDLTVAVREPDGTTSAVTSSVRTTTEVTTSVFVGLGYYELEITDTDYVDSQGIFTYAVACTGSDTYVGVVKLVSNEEVDTFSRIGAPSGSSVSSDIAAVRSETTTIMANTSNIPSEIPTSGSIASAVWDELASSHMASGTMGFLSSRIDEYVSTRSTYSGGAVASVTGDVGGNVLGSVSYVTGTVGSVIGLNTSFIDAPISSRASGNLDYLDVPVSSRTTGSLEYLDTPVSSRSSGNLDYLDVPISSRASGNLDYLDVPISSRTTGSLENLDVPVSSRASGNLDYLDAYVSSRASGNLNYLDVYVSSRASGNLEYLDTYVSSRLSGNLDYLDVPVSSRTTGSLENLDVPVSSRTTGSLDYLDVPVSSRTTGSLENLDVKVSTRSTLGGVAQTGDVFLRLGAPSGSSVSSDIYAVIERTSKLPDSPASTGDIPTSGSIASAVWDEPSSSHTSAGTMGALESGISSISTQMIEVAGLLHKNSVLDNQTYDAYGKLTSARVRIYDSSSNAQAAGSTGLLYSYSVSATYDVNRRLSSYKMVTT